MEIKLRLIEHFINLMDFDTTQSLLEVFEE